MPEIYLRTGDFREGKQVVFGFGETIGKFKAIVRLGSS